MGTIITIRLYHPQAKAIMKQVYMWLKDYEKRFSANDPSSMLSRINQASGIHPVVVSDDLFELIKIGKKESLTSNGQLNIAIGPLVQAWRIGFSDAKVPHQNEIKEKLQFTNPQHILLNQNTKEVYLKQKGMALDLGALAKGYAADLLVSRLKACGVTSGMINLGGNIVVFGSAYHQNDLRWHIGIQDPFQKQAYKERVALKEGSLVTSGVYERRLKTKQNSYHHILDKKTGYPIQSDMVSLTIASFSSLKGEIITTQWFGKGIKETILALNKKEDIGAFIIDSHGNVIKSKHWALFFH